MTASRSLPILFFCCCLVAPDSGSAQQSAVAGKPIILAPHRAVYDLTLEKASGNTLAGVQGRLVYELLGSACSGYTQNMRFVTRSTSNEGEVSISDQRSSTWEDNAGSQFRFTSSQYRDQELAEQSAGTARRDGPEGDIIVELTRPEQKQVVIGGKALFPVQHSIALIAAARRKETLFTADFYDGAENGQRSYLTTAAIGRQLPAGFNKGLPRIANAERLDAVAAWPVSLSYFEHAPENKDAVPAYEMSFVFFDNGVTRRLYIDNGEYTMRGTLTELTFLQAETCSKG